MKTSVIKYMLNKNEVCLFIYPVIIMKYGQ